MQANGRARVEESQRGKSEGQRDVSSSSSSAALRGLPPPMPNMFFALPHKPPARMSKMVTCFDSSFLYTFFLTHESASSSAARQTVLLHFSMHTSGVAPDACICAHEIMD